MALTSLKSQLTEIFKTLREKLAKHKTVVAVVSVVLLLVVALFVTNHFKKFMF